MPNTTVHGTTWVSSTNTAAASSRILRSPSIISTSWHGRAVRCNAWDVTMRALCSTKDSDAAKTIRKPSNTLRRELKADFLPACTCWHSATETDTAPCRIWAGAVTGSRNPSKRDTPLPLRNITQEGRKGHPQEPWSAQETGREASWQHQHRYPQCRT